MRSIRKNNSLEHRPITAQRRLLLSLIRKAGRHITAKELYELAGRENKSISLATVYRTLKLFKELGLVEERRLGEVYCHYEIKESGDHQHLVCRSCGKVIEFDSDLVRRTVERVQRDYDFDVTKAELLMEGYCQECKGEAYKITPVEGTSQPSEKERRVQKIDKKISAKRTINTAQKGK